MSTLTSNALADRAEAIRALVAESDAAAITSIEKALQAGQELVMAKVECRHGEWLPFLERAGLGERKAQQYMQIARSNLKSETVSDLGIRGALRFLQLRERASSYMDQAYTDAMNGGTGVEWLEMATSKMDAMIELFPEEKRDALQRLNPQEDVEAMALRLQSIAAARAA